MDNTGFCKKCGYKLHLKYLKNEGEIPFCDKCNEYRFRMFNTAISAIVYHPDGDKIALIQQYGKKNNILVAGYVTIGEGVEQTLCREVKEELGLQVTEWKFNASEYYEPSNTLMVNFACQVSSSDLSRCNEEVDYVRWYTVKEAKSEILQNSLAQRFLLQWLNKQKNWNV